LPNVFSSRFWRVGERWFLSLQHAELDFCNASSLKQQVAGKHLAPGRNIILMASQPAFISPEFCLLSG
jgi:hypothetical protein